MVVCGSYRTGKWAELWLCAALLAGCGPAPPEVPEQEQPFFRDIAAETGLHFNYFIGASGEYYLPEIMGSGVGLFDYDGDGDLDVYFLQGAMLDPSKSPREATFPPPAEHWPGCRLYRNELIPEGKLLFRDVTEEAGVGYAGYGYGAAVADYDSDGDPDLYVTSFGDNVLYRNNGDGTFTDVTREAGVEESRWSTSSTFVDYDLDNDLDLYVVNYVDSTIENNKDCYDTAGARDYCSPAVYRPVPDRLFRNEGGGKFTDVSVEAGLGVAFGSGLGVVAADINGDGWMDLLVANDGNANQLWQNLGDGTFEEMGLMSGMAYNAHGRAEASMGISAGDFDADGDEDIFIAHLAEETNTLYLNSGSGEFIDITDQAGLGSPSFRNTGFGSHWFDYDHDGWLDMLVANGGVIIVEAQRGSPYPFAQKNQLYRGIGQVRFEEVSDRGGPAFQRMDVSRGAAFGDIDNDGDIDVVISNSNGPASLYLNEVGNQRPWLQVRLEAPNNNRDAVGARVALLREGAAPVWRRVHRDGSYASANDVRVHFGLGDTGAISGVGVVWPGGDREVWRNVSANTDITLREGTGEPWATQ